jgi:chemotaxis protein CheY-P-specific phosphatase CheC
VDKAAARRGLSSLNDMLGEDISPSDIEVKVAAIERVSSSLRDALLESTDYAPDQSKEADDERSDPRTRERSTLRDVLLASVEKEKPSEEPKPSQENEPEKSSESSFEVLQKTLEKIMGAQISELAKMTETMGEISKQIAADKKVAEEKPKPVSKIKIRNIKRSSNGRMQDMDLIVERGEKSAKASSSTKISTS